VYDAPELTVTIRIGPDGYIRVPMLKQRVKVDGLTPAEIETAIATALKQEELFVDPMVTVGIAEYHSRPISVNGAVKMPLVFQAEGPTTLLEALARAQGLSEAAGPELLVTRSQPGPDGNNVMLTRRIVVRNLYDAADPALNLTLYGGEEIRVPEASRIYVVGNVKKPGAFLVKEGADTTVFQMMALTEGLAPYYGKLAYIYRREASGNKNEIVVPLDKLMNRKAPDVTLVANDILYIPENKAKRMTLGALEKAVGIGTALGAASIYVMR
jgi:polysaccharide export outer membrane protein